MCECAAFPKNQEAERELVRETDLMQLAVDDIGTSGRYDTRDDFTVVTQPFFNKTYLPRIVSLISVCRSLDLSRERACALSLSLSLSLSLCQSPSLSLSVSVTISASVFLYLSLCLSQLHSVSVRVSLALALSLAHFPLLLSLQTSWG